MSELPPFIRSEVSSHLCAMDPLLREVFGLPEVGPFSGADFEKVLSGAWLAGYGVALGERANGELGEIASWINSHLDELDSA